jgi:hypothetical protein
MLYLETRNILEIWSAVVLGIHKMYSHQIFHIGKTTTDNGRLNFIGWLKVRANLSLFNFLEL